MFARPSATILLVTCDSDDSQKWNCMQNIGSIDFGFEIDYILNVHLVPSHHNETPNSLEVMLSS